MEDDPSYRIDMVHRCPAPPKIDALLSAAVRRTLHVHKVRRADIGVTLVDDREIARLNKAYLRHRGPTDVLTFDLSEDRKTIEGDIVISVDTATREAANRQHPPSNELALYVVHGVLHLLGYDDSTTAGARRMHAREDAILIDLGIGPVYTAKRGATDAARTRSTRRKPGQAARSRSSRLMKRSGA